tara:strand:+ start:98 stop:982 length:885 start_codon:yes stop_codon:yes gene_type:complete
MENYLYFAEADVNTGGSQTVREGIMVPASKYIGADPVGATSTKFMFESIEGLDEGSTNIILTHGTNENKRCIRAFMAAMNSAPSHGGFVVVADSDVAGASKSAEYSPAFENDVTTVAITETKLSSVLAATHGAGLIGTSVAPATRRWIENGTVVTEIKVDITGLGVKGDAANDVIGLAAGGAAYVVRNVEAAGGTGIITKMTVQCIELPTQGTATITTDIDMAWNASGTLAYDGAAGTAELNMATLVKGETFELLAPAVTANDYLYFVEGDTAASTGVYSGGKFIVTLFGQYTF